MQLLARLICSIGRHARVSLALVVLKISLHNVTKRDNGLASLIIPSLSSS
jgi:hypothetical protein